MDRMTKFLILLVAALVLAPGCFAAEETATATEAVNNTTELVDAVANATIDANNTTVDAAMNLTNVSPLAETGANTSAANATTI